MPLHSLTSSPSFWKFWRNPCACTMRQMSRWILLPASLMIIFTACGYFYKYHPAYSILHLQSEVCAFNFIYILINVMTILIFFFNLKGSIFCHITMSFNKVLVLFSDFANLFTWSIEEDISYAIWKAIGHIHNIPTMQFFTGRGVSRNTQSKSYMLSSTDCVWDFKKMHCGNSH